MKQKPIHRSHIRLSFSFTFGLRIWINMQSPIAISFYCPSKYNVYLIPYAHVFCLVTIANLNGFMWFICTYFQSGFAGTWKVPRLPGSSPYSWKSNPHLVTTYRVNNCIQCYCCRNANPPKTKKSSRCRPPDVTYIEQIWYYGCCVQGFDNMVTAESE